MLAVPSGAGSLACRGQDAALVQEGAGSGRSVRMDDVATGGTRVLEPTRTARLRVTPHQLLSRGLKVMLAAEILVVYLRVRWLMRSRDIRSIVSTLRIVSPRRSETGSLENRAVAVRLGGAVRQTLRILPTDSRCLVQALVLSRLLSARAIPTTLVIGARPEPEFAAHAWVEYEGEPVLPHQGFDQLRLVEI